MTTNHPAHGPVSLERLHQIRETLSKASAQSDGGNLGYAMADAVKVIEGAIAATNANTIGFRCARNDGLGDWSYVYHREPDYFERKHLVIEHIYTAPPAPVVPETLPCPVHLEPGLKFGKGVRTQCLLDALRRRADYYAELESMTPEQRAEHDAGIAEFKAMFGNGSHGDMVDNDPQHTIHTAPTLDVNGKSAFPQRAMQSFGNSEQLIKHRSSNQDSDSNDSGEEIKQPSSKRTIGVQAFIDAMIQDEDVSLTDEGEIPRFRCNSPVIADCWCHTCRPVTMNDMRFVVCPDCGNKRCPRANDHRNDCTGSNEPGQVGSAYPAAPQQEVKSE